MLFLLYQVTTSVLVATDTPFNRIVLIPNEDRNVKVTHENRTLLIKSENRLEIITGDE